MNQRDAGPNFRPAGTPVFSGASLAGLFGWMTPPVGIRIGCEYDNWPQRALNSVNKTFARIVELQPHRYGLLVAPRLYRRRPDISSDQVGWIVAGQVCETCGLREVNCRQRCNIAGFAEEVSELLTGIDQSRPTTPPVDPCQDHEAGEQLRGSGGAQSPQSPANGDFS